MGAEIRIYFMHLKLHIFSLIEYDGWWLMILQTIFIVITDPIGTFLVFSRFGSIGGWTMEQILLIYFIAVTAYGLAETFCRGFDYFPFKMIQEGGFDRVLLRPRSLIMLVAASHFHLHRLPRVFTGLGMTLYLLYRLNVPFSLRNSAILLLALIGGMIMYSGVFILASGIAIFTVKTISFVYILTNVGYNVARCPKDYMPKLLWGFFTFALPMFVISYYPAAALCSWGEPPFTGYLALPSGLAFFAFSALIWKIGVRHYKSTGS